MAAMDREERDELIDLVAQAVIDRIEERDRINGLANLVVARVLALQTPEAPSRAQEEKGAGQARRKGAEAKAQPAARKSKGVQPKGGA